MLFKFVDCNDVKQSACDKIICSSHVKPGAPTIFALWQEVAKTRYQTFGINGKPKTKNEVALLTRMDIGAQGILNPPNLHHSPSQWQKIKKINNSKIPQNLFVFTMPGPFASLIFPLPHIYLRSALSILKELNFLYLRRLLELTQSLAHCRYLGLV